MNALDIIVRSFYYRVMEIDHLTIPVASYEVSKRFYANALAPLGLSVLLDWPDRRRAYFGVKGEPSCLWIVESGAPGSLDVTLAADSADCVDAFHAAALAASAEPVQEPGPRGEYNSEYYAARVFDPDRNAIEVVFRRAARAAEAA
jgi:catechol 2,3-dioxygenase-like lactoylglutathione lyase family enzyme